MGDALDLANTMSAPFTAAVYHPGVGFLCAGVIVDSRWILTTAECVYAYSFENPVRVYVDVGGVKLNSVEAGKESLPLARIVIHPEFHSKEMIYYNNLALMKTMYTISATAYISPITLPSTSAIVPGTAASLVGWGGSSNSFPVTNLQVSFKNTVLDLKECQRLSGMVIDKEFCTDPLISSNTCKYDHGSPLFEYSAVYGSILIGLVNYAPCVSMFFPTVYTSIPDYVDWIQNTISAG